MLTKLITKVIGTSHDREMKRIQPLIVQINQLEAGLLGLSNDQLKAKTVDFKERLSRGQKVDDILPEAFAVCREASKRVLGMRHYDVQMIGGIVLNRGGITEMRTGEGKTLVATLPVYLNALTGKGAHLVTVNDYLAKRDCEWMGQLYNWLGLSTGTIVHERTDADRKKAYGADITYGTNNEFGFDYLRDNMKFDLDDYVQRPFNYAIVDECDSILIDEARTPLIISGPSDDATDKYYEINKIIPHLKRDVHFTMEEKSRTASLTEEGNTKVEELLGLENLFDARNLELLHHIYQGLKAHHLYKLDVDYMIQNGEVVIVDEFTGRLMTGRRWSDGLHQAVEAKEGVDVKSENQTLATITFQNYFRMYPKLSGMTGTAETEAVEFKKIYNLDVVVIPTNRPIQRMDEQDVVYKTEAAKFKAIATDIKARFEKNQPVLVGTVSIERSERLSRMLRNEGITHNVLNAKHHEREAEIVAQAGRKGAVTIATNMAGRGTDIVLGGNAEFLAKAEYGVSTDENLYEQLIKKYKKQTAEEKELVVNAGGLYIIGTERHESRRIDNQLRGRSGRQGDPGESRFYLSLEDDLMRKFNGERVQKIMAFMNVPDDEAMSHKMVSNAIEGAQRKVEGHNFDIRKHLLEYDDVMNKQRMAIYGLRKDVLKGDDIERIALDMLSDSLSDTLDAFIPEGSKEHNWNLEGLVLALQKQFNTNIPITSLTEMSADQIIETIKAEVKKVYDEQKASVGEFFTQLQKMLLLQTIDQRWKEHLQIIDHLKEGIHLRGYAQKDPLIEYKKEGFEAFQKMNETIRAEVVEKMLKVRVMQNEDAAEELLEQQVQRRPQKLQYQGSEASENAGALKQPVRQPGPPPGFANGFPPEGYSPDDGPKMNRAQRREMEKRKKGR
ncbi:MAG: preprotein translocase subunit SecA [Bdellovibrionota bacterium]